MVALRAEFAASGLNGDDVQTGLVEFRVKIRGDAKDFRGVRFGLRRVGQDD